MRRRQVPLSDQPFDGGQFKAVLPVGQSAKGQLVACFAVAQNFGKPNGNRADECKHTDGQGNDFDVVALDEGEFFGRCAGKRLRLRPVSGR